jgi:hypothetical protein
LNQCVNVTDCGVTTDIHIEKVLLLDEKLASYIDNNTDSQQIDIPYGIGVWSEELGNHRAIIRIKEYADAVRIYIPWRRHDTGVDNKNLIIVEAATGTSVTNIHRVQVNREFADLVFGPVSPGEYYLYYLPYKPDRTPFPVIVYDEPTDSADPQWLSSFSLEALQSAELIVLQASDEFDSFFPMEVVATQDEMQTMLADYPDASYLLFPEDRRFPIRMQHDLPLRWINFGPHTSFEGQAQPGEYYPFQIGVFASSVSLEDLCVEFTDFKNESGSIVKASEITCFNFGGNDCLGRPFTKTVNIDKGNVQALWFGVQFPKDATGTYQGTISIKPKDNKATDVSISIEASGCVFEDCGDSDLWRLSRLRWLNSDIAIDDDLVDPYTPLEAIENTVRCLGREVDFGTAGLPDNIRTFEADGTCQEILAYPVSFAIDTDAGLLNFTPISQQTIKKTDGILLQETISTTGNFTLKCLSKMEADGYINFQITLKSAEAVKVNDICLEVPFRREVATYMVGMGKEGGYRPASWEWKWDVATRNQDSLWIGDVTAGLQCKLKGPDYAWPLVNIQYRNRTLNTPEAWNNSGKGGCSVFEDGADTVIVRAYSGDRQLNAGEELHFDFGLLITPVKPIDYKSHWENRYYHKNGDPVLEDAIEGGASIINIHQGCELNPYINYPFLEADRMKEFIDKSHASDMKVKIYYTLREISSHMAELWAMRSLGHEVLAAGKGGGGASLIEHLVDDYAPCWHSYLPNGEVDASIGTSSLSRWHNYYLESLAWLCKNLQIDGLYLDDIGYDREIMKRVRKTLQRERPCSLIDLHSWNHFNDWACWAHCINLYLEHLPYIDSIWFGEAFEYNHRSPDYWMVEISGIPFGHLGEMLEGGGNPWRGMIYGMSNRLSWGGNPSALWKLWDSFGIQDSEMLGYWNPKCPIKTDNPDVLVTAYVKTDKILLAVASWSENPVDIQLIIDWQSIGLDPKTAALAQPAIENLQDESIYSLDTKLHIDPTQGCLLILQ